MWVILSKLTELLCIIALVINISCENKISPPKKVVGIPKDAFWSGGVDGGNWFLVKEEKRNVYYVHIYNDYSGEIEYTGKFKIIGKIVSVQVLKNTISFYSGEKIYLVNGDYMEKICK